jgi:hypothetical protein
MPQVARVLAYFVFGSVLACGELRSRPFAAGDDAGGPLEGISAGKLIAQVSVDKGRHLPGSTATILVTLSNGTGSDFQGSFTARLKNLSEVVDRSTHELALAVGATETVTVSFQLPEEDFRGYLVELSAISIEPTLRVAFSVAFRVTAASTSSS